MFFANYYKIIFLILGTFLIIFSLQCKSILDDKNDFKVIEMFEASRLIISANSNIAWPDSQIIITMQCFPIYSGKGRAILQVISGDSVFVEYPLKDSLRGTGVANKVQYKTKFHAGLSYFQNWEVRLKQSETGYTFEGYVYLDSLSVSASIPEGSVFKNWASSERLLYLSPPPKP